MILIYNYLFIPILIDILKTIDQSIRLIAKLIQLQPKEFYLQALYSQPNNITFLKTIGGLLQEFKIDLPDYQIRIDLMLYKYSRI
ncbi:unnamed protein product [Paramecium sonneborni]|uniref:Uncharacterized protein n=1 Tax=Paramecium sonneborni TaxID=65129 RepID=A0A8S1RCD8_9CILI|nr:unnamed protein product [Paramecium sonneborni]CAD8125933.1 unnamed protein product [Paramecium sonneborni]